MPFHDLFTKLDPNLSTVPSFQPSKNICHLIQLSSAQINLSLADASNATAASHPPFGFCGFGFAANIWLVQLNTGAVTSLNAYQCTIGKPAIVLISSPVHQFL